MRTILNSVLSNIKVLNAALFIAAISIGLSYFTVPILTGIAGFIPACFVTLVMWQFTLALGLLYAEVALGHPDGANLCTFSRMLLGKTWMVIFAAVLSINMIGFLASYVYLIDQFFVVLIKNYLGIELNSYLSGLLGILPFFLIIALGFSFAITANAFLVICLLVTFFLTVILGSSFILKEKLLEHQWVYIFFSVPTLFSIFGYVNVVPLLCSYLKRDPKKIKQSIWLGTTLTCCVYITWQWFMLGSISSATFWVIFEEGASLEQGLKLVQKFPLIHNFLNFTLAFSMTTAFVGHSTAFVHFIRDGFRISTNRYRKWNYWLICVIVLVITLSVSYLKGHVFLDILKSFTTPIGEVLILGIAPVWLVTQMRYVNTPIKHTPVMLFGGKISIVVLSLALFLLIYLEGIVFIRS